MARRHGWQLPAHAFQVLAITVFFLLAVAFYVFFAPFVGSDVLEYTAIGVYSSLVLAVLFLYIRSSAIDPADPGIFASTGEQTSINQKKKSGFSQTSLVLNVSHAAVGQAPAMSIPVRSASAVPSAIKASHPEFGKMNINGLEESRKRTGRVCFLRIACFLCGWFIRDDGCRDGGISEQQVADQDVLFCTLCNAEVHKFSKHCRSCDKCVDGFDHHCRWLNNCVGKKNYVTFVALMASSLTLLILQWGVGVEVFIRCFTDKGGTDRQIVEKLGNSFSRVPYAAVVAICTVISLLASIPLGELFFFHIILIRKGISTYEYVVAMRSQSEAAGVSVVGDPLSIPSSPSSSTATGLSRSTSVGLQYGGGWCTPPGVFVEHQKDEVIPHLGPRPVPSTIDPDASAVVNRAANKLSKHPVRISAWRLAKLNPNEATKAVAKARESSSILRPVGAHSPDTYCSSSGEASTRSSMNIDYGMRRGTRDGQVSLSLKLTYPQSRTCKDDVEIGTWSRSSYSSPSHTNDSVSLSSPIEHKYGLTPGVHQSATVGRVLPPPLMTTDIPSTRHGLPIYKHSVEQPLFAGMAPISNKYEALSCENVEEQITRSNQPLAQLNPSQFNRNFMENKKSVFWDQGAARYILMPVPSRTDFTRVRTVHAPQGGSESGSPDLQVLPSHSTKRHNLESISPHLQSSFVQHDNLLYTEESIFYGGPLTVPAVKNSKMDILPRLNEGTSQKTMSNSHFVLPHQASQEARPLRELTHFIQSPVFQPRSMQTNNFRNIPSK